MSSRYHRDPWRARLAKSEVFSFHILLSVDQSKGQVITRRRTRGTRCKLKHSKSYRTCPLIERWAARACYDIVDSEDERHLQAGVSWEILEKPDAALRYAAMHAAKPHQKDVPKDYQNVGRFLGKMGDVRIVLEGRIELDAEEIFRKVGFEAMSKRGRIKKYLFDFSIEFSLDVDSESIVELSNSLIQTDFLIVEREHLQL